MLAEAAKAATATVMNALQKASEATGVDFNYLLGTAMRESALKPGAKSANSSATGLFQFIEQTWYGLIKSHGAKYGLSSYANAIEKGADGRYHASADDRKAILNLRSDPQISALMAGEYTKETQSAMQGKLGRAPSNGELYAAHLLGPGQACKLIRSAQNDPAAAACELFPQAADANQTVFYHPDGSPKSVREVYFWTVGKVSIPAATAHLSANTERPQLSTAALDNLDPSTMLAAMWAPQRRAFFSSDEESGSKPMAPPALMTPAILDVLQTVAKKGGRK